MDEPARHAALSLEHVTKHLGPTLVLNQISATLEGPGVLGIVGANGSGKTTLLRVIAGILPFASGDIRVYGTSLRNERTLAQRQLGYAPDSGDLPGHLTVAELLSLTASLRGAAELPESAISELSAGPSLHLGYAVLSLGQKRRASLLLAQVGAPRLLLLDEPTNGLDGEGLEALRGLLRRHVERGGSVVMATHDLPLLASLGATTLALPSPSQKSI